MLAVLKVFVKLKLMNGLKVSSVVFHAASDRLDLNKVSLRYRNHPTDLYKLALTDYGKAWSCPQHFLFGWQGVCPLIPPGLGIEPRLDD